MKEIKLNSWNEFEQQISELELNQHGKYIETQISRSPLVFRGQGDSAWKLKTTLDRYFSKEVSLNSYYLLTLIAKPKIETFTNCRWDTIPTPKEYEKWVDKIEVSPFGQVPAYEYFTYLRHHGFPSPLLDWTASPYVAAFFAFNNPSDKSEYVSIFAYQEYSGGSKIGSGGEPAITNLGPNIRTHRRHFHQQSQYTICTVGKNDSHYYANHENIVKKDDKEQDLLWKFNIPVTERKEVLGKLHRMNINAFSLFGTEDSLLETIATTDIFLKGKDL